MTGDQILSTLHTTYPEGMTTETETIRFNLARFTRRTSRIIRHYANQRSIINDHSIIEAVIHDLRGEKLHDGRSVGTGTHAKDKKRKAALLKTAEFNRKYGI